jgi:Zn-dependent oligopeptidase
MKMKVNDYVTKFKTRINKAATPEDIIKAEQELRVETWKDGCLSLDEKDEVFDKLHTMFMTAMYWKPTDMVKKYREEFDYDALRHPDHLNGRKTSSPKSPFSKMVGVRPTKRCNFKKLI